MSDLYKKFSTSNFDNLQGIKAEDLEELELRLREAKEKTSEFIRNYPLASIAIGVGIGYFIGKLLSKK